jgi:tRNA-splicing ligase RtcB
MNGRQLSKLGVPEDCITEAIQTVQAIARFNHTVKKEQRWDIKNLIKTVVESPEYFATQGGAKGTIAQIQYENDYEPIKNELSLFGQALVTDKAFIRPEPIDYKVWGDEIDNESHEQMKRSCSLPMARKAALMPDAHSGYFLPIGGVLGLENAVSPCCVGVDIACRMKMSIYDMSHDKLKRDSIFKDALLRGTVFGQGQSHKKPQDHPIMDEDWDITQVTKDHKDLARLQLGSSGSGNHFAEFGVITIASEVLGLPAGEYVALLTHSGSRGTGYNVCKTYAGIAQSMLPKKYKYFGGLAWLDMDTEAGQEYWAAMELMGRYSAANHDVIHRNVSKILGPRPIAGIENHHNFAWKETFEGKELIVHRKGATPAGLGVLGVIPGDMKNPAYIVQGLGNEDSLCSASHGAGRKMSRKKAKEKFSWNATKKSLEKAGLVILGGSADEVPGCYKDIDKVMEQQRDLVVKIARFDPKIVKMCDDGSRADD